MRYLQCSYLMLMRVLVTYMPTSKIMLATADEGIDDILAMLATIDEGIDDILAMLMLMPWLLLMKVLMTYLQCGRLMSGIDGIRSMLSTVVRVLMTYSNAVY